MANVEQFYFQFDDAIIYNFNTAVIFLVYYMIQHNFNNWHCNYDIPKLFYFYYLYELCSYTPILNFVSYFKWLSVDKLQNLW